MVLVILLIRVLILNYMDQGFIFCGAGGRQNPSPGLAFDLVNGQRLASSSMPGSVFELVGNLCCDAHPLVRIQNNRPTPLTYSDLNLSVHYTIV